VLHQFGEPIAGERVGETVLHMGLQIAYIKVLQGPEAAQPENDRYTDYFAFGTLPGEVRPCRR